MRTSNGKCREAVIAKKPFTANNLYAKEVGVSWYVVYSYGEHFPMYAYSHLLGKWYGNSDRYSASTSKHQSQARPIGEDIEYVHTDQLKELISKE